MALRSMCTTIVDMDKGDTRESPAGHLADKDGFNRVTEDLREIINFTKHP